MVTLAAGLGRDVPLERQLDTEIPYLWVVCGPWPASSPPGFYPPPFPGLNRVRVLVLVDWESGPLGCVALRFALRTLRVAGLCGHAPPRGMDPSHPERRPRGGGGVMNGRAPGAWLSVPWRGE